MTDFLFNGRNDADVTLLLAHGAGAAMDSPTMNLFAESFADANLRVARFEFAYMAARRNGGARRPPPRAETLLAEFRQAVEDLRAPRHLVIGGKSMGGRVASMAADNLYAEGSIRGLLCLGYPFHPPGKPEKLRTAHLEALETPCLIFQGTRDPFGTREEVTSYDLSSAIQLHWFEDGDHDLKPRKKITGNTAADYASRAASILANWVAGF